MATLVINNDSISVSLESDHIIVKRHDAESASQTLPIKDVERVVVVGRPAITFPVLARFMDRGIPCVFLTKGQRWRGTLDFGRQHNVARRMLQYYKLRDTSVCLSLAKGVVAAKLRNCRRVIQRLCANRGMPILDADEHWRGLNGCIADANTAADLDAVRGVEGVGAFHYFRLIDAFMPFGFNFPSRSRRPPLDPANAVLSFAYTVLMNEVAAAVRAHALDVGLGFLHQDRERSPSLALDLMEVFRPGFADLLVLNMISHDRLNPDSDFERVEETGGVYLSSTARRRVLVACESAMSRSFKPLGKNERTTLRLAIDEQVLAFVKYLEDDLPMEFFRLA